MLNHVGKGQVVRHGELQGEAEYHVERRYSGSNCFHKLLSSDAPRQPTHCECIVVVKYFGPHFTNGFMQARPVGEGLRSWLIWLVW